MSILEEEQPVDVVSISLSCIISSSMLPSTVLLALLSIWTPLAATSTTATAADDNDVVDDGDTDASFSSIESFLPCCSLFDATMMLLLPCDNM